MERDGLLQFIVKLAEGESGLETGISLIVGGFLVSGHVISKSKYMRMDPLFSSIEDEFAKASTEAGEELPADDGERRYIHLRDAQYFGSSQSPIPSSGKVAVRVRISEVAGFHMGYLSSSPNG